MISQQTAIDATRVSLVVPCYNEENRLNIEEFRSFLARPQWESVRILFVDDGSTDNTLDVLKHLCAGFEDRATVLRLGKNGGKAEAVRHGMLFALRNFDREIVGFWDADLATPLDTVERFIAILDQNPSIEMVFGSRVRLLGRSIHRLALRHYLGRIFATAVSVVLGLPIYDTQCGAKLFRVTRNTEEMLREPFLSKWVFDVEIIARYLKLHDGDVLTVSQRIYEYPLERWEDVGGSKVRPRDFILAFIDVAKIRGKYRS